MRLLVFAHCGRVPADHPAIVLIVLLLHRRLLVSLAVVRSAVCRAAVGHGFAMLPIAVAEPDDGNEEESTDTCTDADACFCACGEFGGRRVGVVVVCTGLFGLAICRCRRVAIVACCRGLRGRWLCFQIVCLGGACWLGGAFGNRNHIANDGEVAIIPSRPQSWVFGKDLEASVGCLTTVLVALERAAVVDLSASLVFA